MREDAPQYVSALWQPLVMIQSKESISATFVGLDIARSIISKLSITNIRLCGPVGYTARQGA